MKYHDEEWGVPTYDDQKLYEMLVLESFQAGLNWLTILKKREHFRIAFDAFDYEKVATYKEDKISELLQNENIIRHLGKIEAAINNAKAVLRIQNEFGSFSAYLWRFVSGKPIINNFANHKDVPAETELSRTMALNLKQKGFKFLGPTIIYAFMQATGLVNDHVGYCFKHKKTPDKTL